MLSFLYIFQIVLIVFTVMIIMIQKSSDNIFSSSKIFGIRGRSNAIIKLTYILCFIFFTNSIILGILYQRKYKDEMIKESTSRSKKNIVIEESNIRQQVKIVKKQ